MLVSKCIPENASPLSYKLSTVLLFTRLGANIAKTFCIHNAARARSSVNPWRAGPSAGQSTKTAAKVQASFTQTAEQF